MRVKTKCIDILSMNLQMIDTSTNIKNNKIQTVAQTKRTRDIERDKQVTQKVFLTKGFPLETTIKMR